MRTCEGVDADFERLFPGEPREMQRGASNAIAAHLGNRAVGVDHIDAGGVDVEEKNAVASNAAVTIAQSDRLIRRELDAAKRHSLDQNEVVPESLVFEKPQHGAPLRPLVRKGQEPGAGEIRTWVSKCSELQAF